MSDRCVAAVDIGGTRLKLGVVGPAGELLHTAVAPTHAQQPGLLDRVIDLIAGVVDDYRPVAVGVATAGVVDTQHGRIIGGSSNLPGWPGTDVAGGITRRLGLPAAVENDVNAAALGEFWRGAGRDARVFLLVMVGTGMGAGMVLDGKLYHGAYYGGMDISYEAVPGVPEGYYPNPYSAECSIGLAGLRWRLRAARAAGRDTPLDPDTFSIGDLYHAAAAGDALAIELRDTARDALVTVLTNLVYLLDPDRLALGGGLIDAGGDWLWSALEEGVRARLMPYRIPHFDLRRAELGEHSGVMGAAKLAWETVT